MCHFSFHLYLAWIESFVCDLDKTQVSIDIGSVVTMLLDCNHVRLTLIKGLEELGALVQTVFALLRVGEVAWVDANKTKAIIWFDLWVVSMVGDPNQEWVGCRGLATFIV